MKYVVLIGDLKSSRKIAERAKVQEKLKRTLKYVNEYCADSIAAKFRIVSGDSFQGMLSSPESIFDVYYALFEKIGHPFYLGIGIGGISTNLSEDIAEIDGEAFHMASEALAGAKKEIRWIELRSNWKDNDLIACLMNFAADMMWGWTKRQKEVIEHFVLCGRDGKGVKPLSAALGVSERSIYKTLNAGNYRLWKYGKDALEKALSQKRFKD